ncbi:hypothetical protein QX204_24735 [Nocardia sp. PE-7]|uniref:hypothetical protein n=1 Tax=Nocardia sp. PE-7 TaxID=3058426 RepID=UPI0026583B39|nr:hypothetical protein [Nocardia sp. PE-7]WKG08249.1 hypothetical protein QX204_24735 [Nocardia sp. PE-7]
MIDMATMTFFVQSPDGVTVEYDAAKRHGDYKIGAYVRIKLQSERGRNCLALSIDEARLLAEQLPALVMAHDAAERVRAEQVAAEKSATESKAA